MFSIDDPKFKMHRYIVEKYHYIYVYETGTNKKSYFVVFAIKQLFA